MKRTYLSVTPSDERFDPGAVVAIVRALQEIHDTQESDGVLGSMVNKVTGKTYPAFEFVALSRGADEPVEFLYGVAEEHRPSLRHRLEELFPESFSIEEETADPAKAIVPPVVMDPDGFEEAVEDNRLWEDLTLSEPQGGGDDPQAATDGGTATPSPSRSSSGSGSGSGSESLQSASQIADLVEEEVNLPQSMPVDRAETALTAPTVTPEQTVLARPDIDAITPRGLRWHGVGERKQDWMCRLRGFSEVAAVDMERRFREEPPNRRFPLATLIDRLGEFDGPAAFQVVFRHKGNFEGKAGARITSLKQQSDTFLESVFGDMEKKSSDKLGKRYAQRIEEIESKHPSHCFEMTARLVTAPVTDFEYGEPVVSVPENLDPFQGTLSDLSGEYYKLDARRFTEEGWRQRTKQKNARKAFERFRDAELYRDTGGKSQPHLVVNADEFASFITVPSTDELTTEAARSARSESIDRTPLARPDPDELSYFREGMAIGRPLDKNRDPVDNPVAVPPRELTKHWARFAGTGSGKTVATQTDALTLHEETKGPTVVVNQKGDNFAQEYCQAHFARQGHLNDVYYLRVPDILPSIPLFDIRPALADGIDRKSAVQQVKDHFREVMRLVMGRKQFNQASVANEVLGHLVEALFDHKHGSDAYTLDDLMSAARKMQSEQKIPPLSIDNTELEGLLHRHTEKDELQFARTMDGVLNRLSQLHEQAELREILNAVPEWDYEFSCYARGLDFRTLAAEDVVLLLDLGDLDGDSRAIVTYLLLRNLWHGVRPRRRQAQSSDDLPQVNVIIEEAARIATTDLVYENFLPEGRGYGLALGLVMQFPKQVINADEDPQEGKRAYNEMMENINTKICGQLENADNVAETLVSGEVEDLEEIKRRLRRLPSGEWIASLPQTEFADTVPAALSMQSMPIPAGHPEGDRPLQGDQREAFYEAFKACSTRADNRFSVNSVEWWNRDGKYDRQSAPQSVGGVDVRGHNSPPARSMSGDPSGLRRGDNEYARAARDHGYDRGAAQSSTGGPSQSDTYPGASGPGGSGRDGGGQQPDDRGTASSGGGSGDDASSGRGQQADVDESDPGHREVPPAEGPPGGGRSDERDSTGGRSDLVPGNGSGEDPMAGDQGVRDPRDPSETASERTSTDESDGGGEGNGGDESDGGSKSRDSSESDEGSSTSEDADLNEFSDAGEFGTTFDSEDLSQSSRGSSPDRHGGSGSGSQPDRHSEAESASRSESQSRSDRKRDHRASESASSQDGGSTATNGEAANGRNRQQDQKEQTSSSRTPEDPGSHSSTTSSAGGNDSASRSSDQSRERRPADDTSPSSSTPAETPSDPASSTPVGAYLTAEEEALLTELFLAMNREHKSYSLVESGMSDIVDRYDVDVEGLIDDGFLEKDYVVRRAYYTVTPKGREAIDKSMSVGDGIGDLGEKTPHIVGVELAREELESLFDRVETYYRHDETVYDVAAFEGTSLEMVVEVERESNNPDAVVEDYEKMAAVDARAVWVFPKKSVAKSVVRTLHEEGYVGKISTEYMRSMDQFREAIADKDAPGITAIKTYDELIE